LSIKSFVSTLNQYGRTRGREEKATKYMYNEYIEKYMIG